MEYLRHRDWIDSPWDTFFKKRDPLKIPTTGVSKETISHIIDKFSSVPAGIFLLFQQRWNAGSTYFTIKCGSKFGREFRSASKLIASRALCFVVMFHACLLVATTCHFSV